MRAVCGTNVYADVIRAVMVRAFNDAFND